MEPRDRALLDFIASNTDAADTNETRYWHALKLFRDRAEDLHVALATLRTLLDGDTCDCIDSDGVPYQSADLAAALFRADNALREALDR
jgi:hypothetical protein